MDVSQNMKIQLDSLGEQNSMLLTENEQLKNKIVEE